MGILKYFKSTIIFQIIFILSCCFTAVVSVEWFDSLSLLPDPKGLDILLIIISL